MADTRDYSSVYNIKEFSMNQIAAKYLDVENINQLNVGLFGYINDVQATASEDIFNSLSTEINEIFPNIARNPETLYNNAASLSIDDLFAHPAEVNMILFVNEDDITNYGLQSDSTYRFIIDSQLIVDVEGQQFMPDYDIIISGHEYAGSIIFTAQYDISFRNTLSDVTNPYLKTIRINKDNKRYLGIAVKMRRVNMFFQTETIINNDKINFPTLSFNFIDQLANFEVFYTPPGTTVPSQLTKVMYGAPPLKDPFCYYRIKDETTIEISFTMRDNYFQPEFNSSVKFRVYTTNGESGNFPTYSGTNVSCISKSDTYDYNNKVILFAVPQGESMYGRNTLTLEDLRTKIIEKIATSGAYNSESDLQLFFSNYSYRDNNKVLFVKKRDDALERVFSAFSLFKDTNNDYFPTNTLNIDLHPNNFDLQYEQSNQFILKPGHLFSYYPDVLDKLKLIPGKMITDDLSTITDQFVYTNPFLITLQKSPSIVGFYLNSVDQKPLLDYSYVNSYSPVQFICNSISVKRNALIGEDNYQIEVKLMPTSPLPVDTVDQSGAYNGQLKIIMAIEDSGTEVAYTEFAFDSVDKSTSIFTFKASIKTDDTLTIGEKLSVLDMKDMTSGEVENKLIPMSSCVVNIYTLYKYPDSKLSHKFDHLTDYSDYSMTNEYSSVSNPITFISSVDIMRARVKYVQDESDPAGYYSLFSFVPVVGASSIKDSDKFSYFLNLMFSQYNYLLGAMDEITNNYGIDLKFYNTCGRSKNFVVNENHEPLDKTNISIHFKVSLNIGAIQDDVIRDVKIYIKNYIESINAKGYNSIYISNLIQGIENEFTDVKYLKFVQINSYDSSVQVIENIGADMDSLTMSQLQNYVPEYLTLSLNDIIIDILQ